MGRDHSYGVWSTCSHISRVYCLLNNSCLIKLSSSVISILCYDEARTKEKEQPEHYILKVFKDQYVAVGMMQNKERREGIWIEVSSELGVGKSLGWCWRWE